MFTAIVSMLFCVFGILELPQQFYPSYFRHSEYNIEMKSSAKDKIVFAWDQPVPDFSVNHYGRLRAMKLQFCCFYVIYGAKTKLATWLKSNNIPYKPKGQYMWILPRKAIRIKNLGIFGICWVQIRERWPTFSSFSPFHPRHPGL